MADAVVVVTQDYSGLGLALLMQRQGSEVICAYEYDPETQEDLEQVEQIGDGLLPKLAVDDAIQRYTGNDTLWVFDSNLLAPIADQLNARGESVIGTSKLAARMENDRDLAAEVAERVGLALPTTERFTDHGKALTFLRTHAREAYAYKPYKGDPSSTYVPLSADPAVANTELQRYIESLDDEVERPQFILQRIVHGVEVAFDLWLRKGEPIAAFCDLEAKRKLTGDLGEMIGCAGGYVFKLPLRARGVQETVAKYLEWPALRDYTGSVDVNVSFVNGTPLFFENCFRFAYAAYPAMFHALATRRVEDILRDWVAGKGELMSSFRSGFAGSLTLTADNARTGNPILIPDAVADAVDLYRAYATDEGVAMLEGWPEIAVVLAHGRTMEEAGLHCREIAHLVSFPDKGFRLDLTSAERPTLPLSRYRALAAGGYLGALRGALV